MDDHATSRFANRCGDGVQVHRYECPQIDQFGIDSRLVNRATADVDHGSPSDNGYRSALPHDSRGAERHAIVTFWNLAPGLPLPARHGLRIAVERATIEPFRFEEQDRIVRFDTADQQAFGIVWIGRHHDGQSRRVREVGLGGLAMIEPAANAATARAADGHGRGPLATAAITQFGQFAGDLVKRGVEVVGKLDFGHRPETVDSHPDCRGNDSSLGQR